jgi:hypothetical protein
VTARPASFEDEDEVGKDLTHIQIDLDIRCAVLTAYGQYGPCGTISESESQIIQFGQYLIALTI